MALRLKVCGMRDAENIRAVVGVGVDYLGFIFYGKSPRFVGDDFEPPVGIPASVKRVGVFVNAPTDAMLKAARRTGLNALQLHGQEPVEQCLALRETGISVIKVFSVDNTFDFRETVPYRDAVDYFLFDTKGRYHGGNGVAFDWTLLQRYDQAVPFFLSGGLDGESLRDLDTLAGMNLHGLDVNSGVEVSPALKDVEKITILKRLMNE